ncbi:MAG: DUF5995 family protein [Ilumatobacteraceae bacterium]
MTATPPIPNPGPRMPIPITDPAPTTIPAVLLQLDAVVDWSIANSSPIGYFAAVYGGVTRQVQSGIAEGLFDDGSRMERFDVTFASRYLTALDGWQRGRPITRSWQLSFDAAANEQLIVLQHLLLAVDAHMKLDLGVAASTIAPGAAIDSLRDDFDRINTVLDALVPGEKAAAERISPALRDLDQFGRLSDALVEAVIVGWREHSWTNATELAMLVDPALAAAVAGLDERVAADGNRIVMVDPALAELLAEVRRRESHDPAEIIAALRDGSVLPRDPRTLPFGDLTPPPVPPERNHVIVVGAGVGGLTAAHELAERGFSVTVLDDRDVVGGKARSYPVPETSTGGRPGLPGEHGFRFFAGFYRHVIDTMKRIGTDDAQGTAFGHLVDATRFELARTQHPAVLWEVGPPRSLDDIRQFVHNLAAGQWGLSADDVAHLAACIATLLTSCDDRYLGEWEDVSWWDFVGAAERSTDYQQLVGALTRPFVAAVPTQMSTRTGGHVVLRLIGASMEWDGHEDRVLDGPTSEVWIEPWHRHLEAMGVRFDFDSRVTGLCVEDGRVTGVEVVESHGAATNLAAQPPTVLSADWYVLAVPADIAGSLLAPVAAVDPSVAGVSKLTSAWMSGVQLYLATDETMAHGHVLYLNSPWSLTSISQAQFWPDVHLPSLGDGKVNGIISVDICDFDTPGLNGKAARDCSREEIVAEVIAQLAAHQDEGGRPLIDPANVIAANVDDDIRWPDRQPSINVEPMLINTVASWPLRPDATTKVANLVLASDYVRTNTDLATMEGANEAARRAVNALLVASGSGAPPCKLWTFDHPLWAAPFRALDQLRWDLFGRHRHPPVPTS